MTTEREVSRREWHRRRRESGFVGRDKEIAEFRRTFSLTPDDADYQCVFHVSGPAGVGKTWLVRRLESVARDFRALTAQLGDDVHGIPEAMDTISGHLRRQGSPLRTFDKLLANYRQLRHEVENALLMEAAAGTGGAEPTAAQPAASSLLAARLGLIGLGMVPGLGPLAGAIDPGQLAEGGDRFRAAARARLNRFDDEQLVTDPVRVLTPVFLRDLAALAVILGLPPGPVARVLRALDRKEG